MNGCCYDLLIGPLERRYLQEARKELIAELTGRLLDLGAGTGANFPFFSLTSQVTALEPDPAMLKIAESRSRDGINLVSGHAEALPFEDHTFDHVVATLVLCTVAQPEHSLQEIKRVLKPGGGLHFLEHVRAPGALGKINDLVTPLWSRLAGGCRLNRSTVEMIARQGFELENVRPVFHLLGTPFVGGQARSA